MKLRWRIVYDNGKTNQMLPENYEYPLFKVQLSAHRDGLAVLEYGDGRFNDDDWEPIEVKF